MHKRSVVLVGATLLMTGVLLGTQTSGQTTPRPETAAAQPDAKGAADPRQRPPSPGWPRSSSAKWRCNRAAMPRSSRQNIMTEANSGADPELKAFAAKANFDATAMS
jgi:hypothetical protein